MILRDVRQQVYEKLFRLSPIKNPFPLLALPPEIILEMFFNFTPRDAVACSLVCKKLNQITMSEPLWKWLYARDFHRRYPLYSTPVSFYASYKEAYALSAKEKEAWCGCWGYMNF